MLFLICLHFSKTKENGTLLKDYRCTTLIILVMVRSVNMKSEKPVLNMEV